jgi:hypothetical protein
MKQPKAHAEIIEAFNSVWDGTPGHALAIRDLILATQDITRQAGTANLGKENQYV